MLVGYSLGSGVATLEAATYRDVDGVILTGISHLASALAVAKGFTVSGHPSMWDPQLRKNGNDPGYSTSKPGQRVGHGLRPTPP